VIVHFKSDEAELNADLATMREAGKNELFLADLEEAWRISTLLILRALSPERSRKRL
jgi:hypothetical protein